VNSKDLCSAYVIMNHYSIQKWGTIEIQIMHGHFKLVAKQQALKLAPRSWVQQGQFFLYSIVIKGT